MAKLRSERKRELKSIAKKTADGWWELLRLRRRLQKMPIGVEEKDYKFTTDNLIEQILKLEGYEPDVLSKLVD